MARLLVCVVPTLLASAAAAQGGGPFRGGGRVREQHGHSLPSYHPEPFKCDLSREMRAMIELEALEILRRNGFELIETGFFANRIPTDGETVAGNPDTLYAYNVFNDSSYNLVPQDYPPIPAFIPNDNSSDHPSNPPHLQPGFMGVTFQRNEAVAFLMCTPPPATYFGLTAYVFNRILFDVDQRGEGDADILVHTPVAEIKNPMNYLTINVTAGLATEKRKEDPSEFFGSAALFVYSPSREVNTAIREAFIQAGLSPNATNYYPLSGQTIRLHDRSKPSHYDYPDMVSILSRTSYFENQTVGYEWGRHVWPTFFLRAPDDAYYQRSVPEQKILNDKSGDSELPLVPYIEQLLDAIIANKTKDGKAKLVKKEQIVPVPNDRATRDSCLNNASFTAAVDPIMTKGGCGFGTTDCRYGTSAALDQKFADNRFFVVVGVKHEAKQHSSYSSVMLTSGRGYEQRNHTITFRESDGAGSPQSYLPTLPEMEDLYAMTLARSCPEADRYCIPFTTSHFKPDDVVYWMERAYLQQSTGVAPNIEEYVMSYVLTFEGEAR